MLRMRHLPQDNQIFWEINIIEKMKGITFKRTNRKKALLGTQIYKKIIVQIMLK